MNIEEKLDIIMDTPLQLAIRNLKTAMNLIETSNFSSSMFYLRKLTGHAQQAFEYASGKQKNAENFKKSIDSLKLVIFSKILIFSYHEDEGKFLPFFLVVKPKQEAIARELEDEIRSLISLHKMIKTSKWFPGT